MKLEDSSSWRVASKSWSISLGIQADQSSRTVRERWPARLARITPKAPPLKAAYYTILKQASGFLASGRTSRYTSLSTSISREIPLLPFEPHDQFLQRQKKLAEIEARGHEAYPHKFEWTATPAELFEKYASADAATLEAAKPAVRVAGRILTFACTAKRALLTFPDRASGCRFM